MRCAGYYCTMRPRHFFWQIGVARSISIIIHRVTFCDPGSDSQKKCCDKTIFNLMLKIQVDRAGFNGEEARKKVRKWGKKRKKKKKKKRKNRVFAVTLTIIIVDYYYRASAFTQRRCNNNNNNTFVNSKHFWLSEVRFLSTFFTNKNVRQEK